MDKLSLIKSVCDDSEHDERTVRAVLDSIVRVTADAISRHEDVALFGLGKLTCVTASATVASNFGRSTPITVPKRVLVRLKPSKMLGRRANGETA